MRDFDTAWQIIRTGLLPRCIDTSSNSEELSGEMAADTNRSECREHDHMGCIAVSIGETSLLSAGSRLRFLALHLHLEDGIDVFARNLCELHSVTAKKTVLPW
jgi:hypothetical protein